MATWLITNLRKHHSQQARFTYDEVQDIIDRKGNAGKRWNAAIHEMEKLREVLTAPHAQRLSRLRHCRR